MDNELIKLDRQEAVTVVTLNRPEALNALSTELRNSISSTFDLLAQDAQTQVIVLTGAGRAFSVGLDLKELGGEIDKKEKALARDVELSIAEVGKPVIGAVNGFAITGGFELALMCDFLIATPSAKFADTHARVGVVPGWGLSQKLPRLIGINRAKELSLTGNFLDAETAMKWGLVNRVVEEKALISVCVGLGSGHCLYRTSYTIRDKKDHGLRLALYARRWTAMGKGSKPKSFKETQTRKRGRCSKAQYSSQRALTGRRMILLTLKLLT